MTRDRARSVAIWLAVLGMAIWVALVEVDVYRSDFARPGTENGANNLGLVVGSISLMAGLICWSAARRRPLTALAYVLGDPARQPWETVLPPT